jgi:CelD/BcsL family acetyltransferase involved in cellulose biosynthesis
LRYVPSHYHRFMIEKTGTFKDYLGKFSAKRRYNLNRTVKKYYQAAGTQQCFKLYRTPDELLQFHAIAQQLAPHTYQARLYENQLPDTPEFKQQLVELARQERTLGAILFMDDRPVVFWWFTRHGGVLLSEFTGFDSQQRALSPGTVLLYLVLEQVFADARITLFDFGEGDAFYKELFATGSRRCAEIFYLRPQARTLSMVSLDTSFWAMRRALRPVEQQLEKRGIKARLKRLIRG